MQKPRADLKPNTADYENFPLVTANGFREYDARWLFGKEINLLGIQALGLGLGTYLHDIGVQPKVVTGHDYRSYSLSIKQALIIGLMQAGCEVHDIGLALVVFGIDVLRQVGVLLRVNNFAGVVREIDFRQHVKRGLSQNRMRKRLLNKVANDGFHVRSP